MGGTLGKVSIDTSTSSSGGSPGSSSGDTSENSFTTGICFSRGPSLSEFQMYARYPIHPFLRSLWAVTTNIKAIGLRICSP
jgi:hypothetical protein